METIAIISFLGGLAIGCIVTLIVAAKVFSQSDEQDEPSTYYIRFKHREGHEGEYYDERSFTLQLRHLNYGCIISQLQEIDRAGENWEYLITEIHEI